MKLNDQIISEKLIIRELRQDELEQAYHIVKQLRTSVSLEDFIKTINTMKNTGYKMVCLFEDGKIVSFAGFERKLTLYGDHIWVHELVTDINERSKGYGKLLLTYVENIAKEYSLKGIALSSRLEREDAHRFYENIMGYTKASYLYRKEL